MSHPLADLVSSLGIKPDSATTLCSGSGFDFSGTFEVEPEDFLEQAEEDYERGGSSSLLNSIHNSRRAVRCAIDRAVTCVGFDPRVMSVKQDLALLSDIGFLTPSILRRVSDTRNLLEHEYQLPSKEAVEEALDLASLFVEATSRNLEQIASFSIGNRDESLWESPFGDFFRNQVAFGFEAYNSAFRVYGYRNRKRWSDHPESAVANFYIPSDDPIFLPVLRLSLSVGKDRPRKTIRALGQLFDALIVVSSSNGSSA